MRLTEQETNALMERIEDKAWNIVLGKSEKEREKKFYELREIILIVRDYVNTDAENL